MAQTKIKLGTQGFVDQDIDFQAKKITNLAAPTNAGDACTKAYADGIAGGVDPKDSVRVATAAALPANTAAGSGVGKTLTLNSVGILTVDGVNTVLGDRVLVKDEVTGVNNGIYEVTTEGNGSTAAILTRATDADEDAEVTSGMFVFVEEGTVNSDSGFVLVNNGTVTVDTTALSFSQFSGAGQIVAGGGMTKSGNTLDVVGTTNRIVINADSVDIGTDVVTLDAAQTLTNKTLTSPTLNSPTISTPSGLVKGDVLLGNVDDTSDANKPVSTAQQTALDLKLTIAKYAVREALGGVKNGSNTAFTFAAAIVSGTEMIFLNGVLQDPGAGNDYTITGVNVTMAIAPISTDKIVATSIKS